MSKFILIAFILFATSPAFAGDKVYTEEDLEKYKINETIPYIGEHWIELGKTQNSNWYYNKQSLYFPYQSKNIIRFELKAESWEKEAFLLTQINCLERKFDILQITEKLPGKEPITITPSGTSHYITDSTSIIGNLFSILCKPF